MKKIVLAGAVLVLLALALTACGDGGEGKLNAGDAYQTAVNATEDAACTDDECQVVLYDDDGDTPYRVVSPVAFKMD